MENDGQNQEGGIGNRSTGSGAGIVYPNQTKNQTTTNTVIQNTFTPSDAANNKKARMAKSDYGENAFKTVTTTTYTTSAP